MKQAGSKTLNECLKSKRCSKHTAKAGIRAPRAAQKQELRKQMYC